MRVVSEIRPWYVVMENVPGILTIQKGDVKTAIIEAFESIGYPHISVAILESAAYGVPQIRPRAIFIANRFGMPNPYPQSQLNQEEYKPIESAISDLPEYTPIPEINHEWTKHYNSFVFQSQDQDDFLSRVVIPEYLHHQHTELILCFSFALSTMPFLI